MILASDYPKTQEEAVLTLLRTGPKYTADFLNSIYGLAAEYRRAITTLRHKGYVIAATQVRKGSWRYRLIQEPGKIEPSGQLTLGLVGV